MSQENKGKPTVSVIFPDVDLERVKACLREEELGACDIGITLLKEMAADIQEIPRLIPCETADNQNARLNACLILGGRRDALRCVLKSALPALRSKLIEKGFGGLEIIGAQLVAQGILQL